MTNTGTIKIETVDLTDDIMGALIDNGFQPMDCTEDDLLGINERAANVLDYFAERGWDAFRIDASSEWATLVRWTEDNIDLLAIDENGVGLGQISFPMTPRGVVWLTAVIG